MKTTTMQKIKTCALFLVALGLSACGGGSGSQVTSLCSQTNLSACGGGTGTGGGTTGGGQTTTTPKMTLTLVDQSGNSANLLTSSGALTVRVQLTNSSGLPVSGAVVKFAVGDGSLVTVNPASNLTDANGVALATATLASPDALGATTITAASSYTDTTGAVIALSGSVNFKVGNNQTTPDSVVLVSISPATHSILLRTGVIGVGRVQTAQVIFKVTGTDGQPVANQKVLFTFQPTQDSLPMSDRLTFASTSGITGQDGQVIATVNSGTAVTVAAVRITVVDQNNTPLLDRNGRTITSVSDQITVTNTLLNPNGVSISADIFELEAINVFGKFSTITFFLTDLQGGAINDGTAIAFATNGGAIVGEFNSAKCTTKDGQCSVILRGQNPQPPESILHFDGSVEPKTAASTLLPNDIDVPKGVAVIIASLQLNGNIVKAPILIVMSGSYATFAGDFTLDFTAPASCNARTINFNTFDVNGNAMPFGSVVTVAAPQNASGEIILGSTVKNQDPLTRGGTTFLLQVTPGGKVPCSATGTHIGTGSFYLLLTTPYGIQSAQVVTVKYPID